MSGTRDTDDRKKRADHEAGHFVAAHALGILVNPLWVTIEPRERSGGSTKIDLREGTGLVPKLQYFLAGIAAEGMEAVWTKYVNSGSSPTEAQVKQELVQAFITATDQGGHDDVVRIDKILEAIPAADRPDVGLLLWETFSLLSTHMDGVKMLSKALLKRETLYMSEALYLLAAHGKPEPEKSHMLKFHELSWFPNKGEVPHPPTWLEGGSDVQRKKPFFEGPVEYFQRMNAPPP